MLTLDASKTALVVIDLQEGILPFAGGPHAADEVVSRAARLAEKCRASGAPVVMVRVGERVVLSLWQEASAVREIGPIGRAEGPAPITLAHNVASPSDVDRVLAEASAAGATVLSEGAARDWGGYTGYFADPDGFRWEIAYNPGPIGLSVL